MPEFAVRFQHRNMPIPGVNPRKKVKDKEMSFLKNLIQPLVKVAADNNLLAEIAKWVEIFKENFGSSEPESFKKGDEGFYHLLSLEQHDTIALKAIEAPAMFCRAKILSAFFLGQSTEMVDGKREARNYPKATGAEAKMVAEAVSPILVERLQAIISSNEGGVGRYFWVTDKNHSDYDVDLSGGKDAQEASGLMHCLLNVAEGTGDNEALKELATWFKNSFGNLPPGIYHRVHDNNSQSQQQLVGNGQAVQREGDRKPANKKRNKKAESDNNDRDPMKRLRPTPADEQELAEYKAKTNGHMPSNDGLKAIGEFASK